MDKKIVIIPTYNEKENIENIIRAVFALEGDFHILVIEDGSPDGTANIVKRLQGEFPQRLFMIERKGKLWPWNCIHNRFQMVRRAGVRLYIRDGRRLFAQSGRPSETV